MVAIKTLRVLRPFSIFATNLHEFRGLRLSRLCVVNTLSRIIFEIENVLLSVDYSIAVSLANDACNSVYNQENSSCIPGSTTQPDDALLDVA